MFGQISFGFEGKIASQAGEWTDIRVGTVGMKNNFNLPKNKIYLR